MNGEWRVKFGAETPRLESPVRCWRAESAPFVDLEIAYKGQDATAQIFWKRMDDQNYNALKSLSLDLTADRNFHKYRVNLASSPEYRDLIIGLAIELVGQPRPAEEMAIKSVVLSADAK